MDIIRIENSTITVLNIINRVIHVSKIQIELQETKTPEETEAIQETEVIMEIPLEVKILRIIEVIMEIQEERVIRIPVDLQVAGVDHMDHQVE